MPIRLANYDDLLPASKVMAAAFEDNDLFDYYMHPKRKDYPEDFYLYFLRQLRIGYVSGPRDKILVAYKTGEDGAGERITGVAHWIRMTAKSSQSLYTSTAMRLMHAYNYLESLAYPNRAADPSRLGMLGESAPYYQHRWTGTRGEVWMLSHLAVDPKSEGQGVGRILVNWGFDQAREEGVGCTVISAAGKDGFYRKCGFDVDDGNVNEHTPPDHPLRSIPGGAVYFWENGIEPKGVKKYGES
jgi:GNAT superfamily N-acetyltransferase